MCNRYAIIATSSLTYTIDVIPKQIATTQNCPACMHAQVVILPFKVYRSNSRGNRSLYTEDNTK